MPNAPSTAVSLRWQPVAETLAEFREECLGFEYEVGSLLDQVERLHGELDRKARELDSAWEEVFTARAELSEAQIAVKHSHAELAKSREDAQQAREASQQVRDEAQRLREDAEVVRREAQQARDEAQQALTKLQTSQDDAKRARDEAQVLRNEAQQSRSELQAARDDAQRLRDEMQLARDEARQAREALQQARDEAHSHFLRQTAEQPAASIRDDEQFAEIERERAALEAELELVRGRAAELYNVVAEQKRDMAHQRDETVAELKQLRLLAERQAEVLAAQPVASLEPVAVEARTSKPAAEQRPAQADPVVNSVMAQFAKLQQDVAQRRKHKK